MLPNHTAVVFAGGGTRGIAYAGALDALRRQGIDWGLRCPKVKTVAGCSIGAMTALLVVLGFSAHEIGQLVLNTPFEHLVSLDPMQMLRVLTEGSLGLDPGNVLRDWLATQIARKTTCDVTQAKRLTLSELKAKTDLSLVCVTTNLVTREQWILSPETTPNVVVVDAVQASMALPPLFQPVEIQGILCSDGGLVNNFPLSLFEEDEVVGLRLMSTPQTIPDIQAMRLPLIGFINYVVRILTSSNDSSSYASISESMRTTRVISISCGKVSTFESDVASVKDSLFQAGVDAVTKFFSKEVR
jgi:predicted acylesterase/phospholipase RssA